MVNIDCSNELGNTFYKALLKKLSVLASNREQRQLVGYALSRSDAVQIYNATDVMNQFIHGHNADEDGISAFIKSATGIDVTVDIENNCCTYNYSWTPYVDDLFVYSETDNGLYYTTLIHRISDTQIVLAFGTVDKQAQVTMAHFCTVELKALSIYANYSRLSESIRDLINRLGVSPHSRQAEIMYKAIHICFTSTLAFILKMFHDLTDKAQPCRCYVDTTEDTKTDYFRSPLDKKVTKVGNKPIILVLNNDKEADKKAQRYKRRGGRIQYAFSWVVRGHYRRLHNPKSIGLDRNGKRCVQGATWIETYMKGDENLPLLRRERIVIGEK